MPPAIPESRQQLGTRANEIPIAAESASAAAEVAAEGAKGAQLETPNYRSGHLRNYPSHRVSLGKSFINFVSCHCTMMMTHTLQSELSCCLCSPHARFDVNFITLPEISCTHNPHTPHSTSVPQQRAQSVHSLENILCSVLYAKCASGVIFHRGI